MPPDHSPEITVRDIWDQLNKVGTNVETIKLNVTTIETRMDAVLARANDHELRLRVVEQLFAILNEVPDRVTKIEQLVPVLNDVPGRLTSVERKVLAIPGIGTIISILALAVAFWRGVKG